MLKTAFWIKAANSLPANIRARYLRQFERAERWELAFDSFIELFSIQSLPRRPGRSETSSSSSG